MITKEGICVAEPFQTGNNYDWSNKNLRVVEWVPFTEQTQPKRDVDLYVITKTGQHKRAYYWKDDHEGGIYFVDAEFNGFTSVDDVEWWFEVPKLPKGGE